MGEHMNNRIPKQCEGLPTFGPNEPFKNEVLLLDSNGKNYVSFNPEPCRGMVGLESDNMSAETAMYFEKRWYILNGDYRREYEEALAQDGIRGVLGVYQKHCPQHRSSWSSSNHKIDNIESLKRFFERMRNNP